VPADLPPDQSRALAALMLSIHGHFRARHGRPPLPTAWTLLNHLHTLRDRSLLTDQALLGSGRGVAGGLVTRARAVLWHVLKPLLFRQSEVNRDLVLALEALARDHGHALHVHRALSARIADLEDTIARLRRHDP
jgi:hypothetical protein